MTVQEVKDNIMYWLREGVKNPLSPITDATEEQKIQAVEELELDGKIMVVREEENPIIKGQIKRIYLSEEL